MAAVRPEFRVDVLVHEPNDPVLGVKPCTVADCDRPVRDIGLCNGHGSRWRQRGRPDQTEFLADPGPAQMGRRELSMCTVQGCRYGASGHGLCQRHRDRWDVAGCPDAVTWAASAPTLGSGDRAECSLSFCTVWTENNNIFCKGHHSRWRQAGCPEVAEFVADCERYGKAVTDFRGLSRQLKLELQYAVQCRRDEQSATAPPKVVRRSVLTAAESGVTSLLDLSEAGWQQHCRRPPGTAPGGSRTRSNSFLLYARDLVETLRDGSGWEAEYPRDVWRLDKLPGLKHCAGRPRPRSHLRFDRITQPWLKNLAKRWVRMRLTSGLSVGTGVGDVQARTRFSEFLAVATPDIDGLAGVNRALLERHLAWLTGQPGGVSANESRVGALHLFFQAIRQHGWDNTLPTTAVFFTGDFPRRLQRLTRYLAEHVMAQLEQPANLGPRPNTGGACPPKARIPARQGLSQSVWHRIE